MVNTKKKKKVFTINGTLFFPNSSVDLRSDAHQSQIIEGDADQDHTQIIGRDTVKLSLPIPLRVSAPLILGYSRGCAAAMLRRNINHNPEMKRFLCSKTGEDHKARFSPRNETVFVPENR